MNSSEPTENSWEAAELSTLREGARLTFRERPLWLGDMLDFADRFCGAASGRKIDRDGNIVSVATMSQRPVQAVAEEQSPYQPEPPPAPPVQP